MRFSRIFLNRLQNQPGAEDTVVVIDVLRSFTTAAVALAQGASAIYPVEGGRGGNRADGQSSTSRLGGRRGWR